jgi:hypothetical protein
MTYEEILQKIGHLPVTSGKKDILRNIFDSLRNEGYSPDEERIRIVVASLDYLGFEYLMTQELSDDNKIDCSTLTSQSYWEGAMIGIPFIAERQRTAPDGVAVEPGKLRPADIVIKFPDIESSFDKKHNHVGLVLGRWQGILYLIESNAKEGCVISTYEKFNPTGGSRRYIKNEGLIIGDEVFSLTNKLSKSIPKLARLGAKQEVKNSNERIPHTGIDIFIQKGMKIYAPIGGKIEPVIVERENVPGIRIRDMDYSIEILIGNVLLDEDLEIVHAGQKIGTVFDFAFMSPISYAKMSNQAHIHFEVRLRRKWNYWVNSIDLGEYKCINGLYAIKMGSIANPLTGKTCSQQNDWKKLIPIEPAKRPAVGFQTLH